MVVGFDASDVGRLLGHQDVHQVIYTGLELCTSLKTQSNIVVQHCNIVAMAIEVFRDSCSLMQYHHCKCCMFHACSCCMSHACSCCMSHAIPTSSYCGWSLLGEQLGFREHLQDDGISRCVGCLLQTPVQQVVVLVNKTWEKARNPVLTDQLDKVRKIWKHYSRTSIIRTPLSTPPL